MPEKQLVLLRTHGAIILHFLKQHRVNSAKATIGFLLVVTLGYG